MNTKVTLDQIINLLNEAETQEHIFGGNELLISYKFKNGVIVAGRTTCADPDNFVLDVARKMARDDAARQILSLNCFGVTADGKALKILP